MSAPSELCSFFRRVDATAARESTRCFWSATMLDRLNFINDQQIVISLLFGYPIFSRWLLRFRHKWDVGVLQCVVPLAVTQSSEPQQNFENQTITNTKLNRLSREFHHIAFHTIQYFTLTSINTNEVIVWYTIVLTKGKNKNVPVVCFNILYIGPVWWIKRPRYKHILQSNPSAPTAICSL